VPYQEYPLSEVLFNAGDFLCVAKMDTERPAKNHELENHRHTSYKSP
jgi:hypothetical protein